MEKNLVWILVGLLALNLVFSIANMFQNGNRYGLVNLDRIAESPKGKELEQAIREKQDEYQQKYAADIKGQTDSKKIAERQAFYQNAFSQWQQNETRKFGKEVDQKIAKIAKEKGLTAVFTKDALRYSKYDITDQLLEELK